MSSEKPRGVSRRAFLALIAACGVYGLADIAVKGPVSRLVEKTLVNTRVTLETRSIGSATTPYVREFENVSGKDDVLVGAFYYPWYGPGDIHWKEGYKGTPLLGRYYSGDPVVISKHIDWATGFGIDFFIVSWWGPSGEGQRGQPDSNLKYHFLANQLASEIKLAIAYESLGRLRVNNEGGVDFDNPENLRLLLTDFDYLAETYFGNANYLRVHGAPVVFLYLSRIYAGDIKGALQALRNRMREKGFELYLIGDQVYWQDPSTISERRRIQLYDGVSAYNMHTAVPALLANFEARVDSKYGEWFDEAKRLGVDFIPDAIPGYDDTIARPQAQNPIIPKTVERFRKQTALATKYLDDDPRMVFVTSFNEWHEYTYVEPSVDDGFTYLQVLKEGLSE